MKARAAPLAKLSRPRLHDALPRERLFARLDALRKQPVIWISGPPGAGKTTLVASYMDARGLGGLWYQLDAGDLDISTCFFYLGEAAKRLAPDRPALALLTQEYLPDLAGFSRRWFRQFFARLSVPGVLVFDNYQEAADSSLDAVLSAAVADIPEGLNLVLISRTDPPSAFARALAHGELTVMGWDDLKLTIEEATAVAAAKGVSSLATVNDIFAQSEGWAAGLTLMLERVRYTGAASQVRDLGSMETIFGYFAGLVFDALPDTTKKDIVLCSYLPSVSESQAAALTGNAQASRLLDQLYRRHLFTNRRHEGGGVYEFHALFRAFLQARAERILTVEQRTGALRDAARLLLASGQVSEALALYAQTQDWPAIEDAVLVHAGAVLAQGRGQTLRDWISLLPAGRVERSPWILYWLGTALMPYDQQRARTALTRAYEALRAADDFGGQVAAASGVVETYFFSFSGYSGLKEWTQNLAGLLEQATRFLTREQRLQACAGYLLAAFFGDGTHPEIDNYVQEIKRLLREPLDPNLRLRAGTFLVTYAGATLQPALVRDDLELLDSLAADPAAAPLRQAQWQNRYAYLCYQHGDYELALARLAIGRRLCTEHGLRTPVSLFNQITTFVCAAKGDAAETLRMVEQWEAILSTDRPVERSQWNIARLVALVLNGERKGEWVGIAHEIAAQMDATGQTWIRLSNRIPGAFALIECGEYETARRWVADLRAIMNGTCYTRYERDALWIEASLALHENQAGHARDCLLRALRLTAAQDIPMQCAQSPRLLGQLLNFAVHEAVEADTARSLAVRYHLALNKDGAPAHATPLRVATLGRFEISKDGQALAFKGKAQQRPLGLLKLLVAQGGRGVPVSVVTEGLWPDSEGDDAANALRSAVHRLRKLLGYDAAIKVQHGALFLQQAWCWADVQAFEELAERAELHRLANEMERFEAAASEALSLYQGAFLPAEEALPWLVAARDRLAQKARQLILALGSHFEATARAQRACILYESGLAIDSLSELLYQRLIRAHMHLAQYAEAMQVYRRCRELLSIVLGIPPSAESQALFRQAQEQARIDHP